MAKKQGNRRNMRNYFQTNIEQNGEDFLSRKTPLDIQKDAKKIFLDIAHGSINIERDAIYFTNVSFLMNLLSVAQDNLNYHSFTANGMKQIINQAGVKQIDQWFIKVLDRHEYCARAYNIVCKYITNILNNQGATICLTQMVQELQQYRGAFQEMFIVRDDYARRQERGTY